MVLGFAVAIYRLIFEWDNNKNDLLSVLVVNPGGLAIYGGVLGGVVVAFTVKKNGFPLLGASLTVNITGAVRLPDYFRYRYNFYYL